MTIISLPDCIDRFPTADTLPHLHSMRSSLTQISIGLAETNAIGQIRQRQQCKLSTV
ncbi:MAG: hypothetical protein LH613_13520 [Chamaesiphon sp.]|nr:hypothetical protein [Chamaesiphon sp.]